MAGPLAAIGKGDMVPTRLLKPGASAAAPRLAQQGRRFERRAYAGKVLRLDGPPQECGALDLCAGGVGLLTTEAIDVGQVIKLAFLAQSVRVEGCVTHVRPMSSGDWRIGVRFLQEEHELADVALAAN